MPLPQLGRRTGHQTLGRTKRAREIGSKDTAKRKNLANKISMRIKNSTQAGLKTHLKSILKKLRNRKQIKMQIRNQSNILEKKALIDPHGPTRQHLTLAIVPESDVLFTYHGVEAGEPFGTSGHVARTSGVNEPRVLQASVLHQ
jgi:hypothetical protein